MPAMVQYMFLCLLWYNICFMPAMLAQKYVICFMFYANE